MIIELSPLWGGDDRTIRIGGIKLPWPFPITSMTGSSSARVFGRAVYGGEGNRPIIGAIHHRIVLPLYRAKWWLWHRYVPRYRYHIINTGLEPNYYDCDTLMLHACFKLLCRYVEKEHGGADKLEAWANELRTEPDKNAPEGWQSSQGDKEAEAVALYRWWKIEKPADEKRHDELMHRLFGRADHATWVKEGNGLYRYERRPWTADEEKLSDEFVELGEKIDNDEQAMLHRLIDIRQRLWT